MDTIAADASYWVDVTCPQCGETDKLSVNILTSAKLVQDHDTHTNT